MAPKNHYVQLPSSNPKPVASAESESADSEPKAQPQARSSPQAQTSFRSGKKHDLELEAKNANGNTSKRLKKKKKTASAAAAGGSDDEVNDCMEEASKKSHGKVSKLSKKKETVSAAAAAGGSDVQVNDCMEEASKKSGGRVFGEKDDLDILSGLADFLSKTGKDPLKHSAEFYYFMQTEKSFRSDLSNMQIKRKIRTLKDKFEKSHIFTKPHDKKAFKLFKKIIWTNNDEDEAVEENRNNVESSVEYILNEIFRFDGDMTLNKDDAKKGLESWEESLIVEREEKWRKLRTDEMNLVAIRMQYAKDRARLVL